jgi:hypothetical protein
MPQMRKEADINFSGNHRPLRGERPPDHASTHKFLSDAKSAKLELRELFGSTFQAIM